MREPRRLSELAEAMEALSSLDNRGDTEANHEEADELLLEAIERLSDMLARISWWPKLNEESAQRIIEAYKKLPKWYA